jgi:hypothetical protein
MIRRFFTPREGTSATEKATGHAGRRSGRRRPALEALEQRNLLSLVSVTPNAPNNTSDNASAFDGRRVAVWVSTFPSRPNDHDSWAQRLDRNGNPVDAAIQVDFTTSDSFKPHVSMDNLGRFVVAWENYAGGIYHVMMRWFNWNGTPLTGITQVSASSSSDYNPDVAASNSSFVISWTHRFSTQDTDIYAERFVVNGNVPTGQGIFGVNTDTNAEDASSVAMAPNGNYDIAYERQFAVGSNDWDIFLNQYGAITRSNIHINFDGLPEFNPSVSMDNNSNAVVAYQRLVGGDYGIYANRFTYIPGTVSPLITVRDVAGVNETDPSVALARGGSGHFVVAYDTGGGVHQVTEMFPGGPVTLGPLTGWDPAISIDGSNHYVVTYTQFNTDPSRLHNDIFSRIGLLP